MNGLKYIRNYILGKTMDELADVLEVSKQAVYMWESGRKKIPQKRLEEMSRLTGIPQDYFLIEDVTDRDKMEILKHRVNKEVGDTMPDEEDGVRYMIDPVAIACLNLDELQVKMRDTINKITTVMAGEQVDMESELSLFLEELAERDRRRKWFDRFADIVHSNPDPELMKYLLRAMEVYIVPNVKNDAACGTDFVYEKERLVSDNLCIEELVDSMDRCERYLKRKRQMEMQGLKDTEE